MGDLNRPEDDMGLPIRKMTLEEFLEWEEAQPERHEFWRGEIFAMVGEALRHNRVVLNLARRIGDHLDGSGCQVFTENVKVRLGDDGILYPDVVVTCHSDMAGSESWITEPRLIVEVLSPSTMAYDRGDKFALYRMLPSLQAYVLVNPAKWRVEVFTRGEAGTWLFADQTDAKALTLASIDLTVPFDHLFKGTATPSD
jgi:Uma2 family endonuclease